MCIVGRWWYTPYTEDKYTLDSVPIYLVLLHCILYRCPSPGVFLFSPCNLSISPPTTSATAAVATSLDPDRSSPACSYHHIYTRASGVLSVSLHRPRSDCIDMNCGTVLYLLQMYSSIAPNHTSSLSTTAEVYYHLSSVSRLESFPVNRRAI